MYTEVDFQNAVEESAGPKPLDVVYDGVGADTFMKGIAAAPRDDGDVRQCLGGPGDRAPSALPKGSLFLTRPSMGLSP